MAHMSQQKKQVIAKALKPVLAKYGVKGSLRVRNHTAIVLTLKSGKIDFIENFINADRGLANRQLDQRQIDYIRKTQCLDVNPYWFHEHFDGKAKAFLTEAFKALKSADYYDRSDAMTDYFDTAYYFDLQVGRWNKPYEVAK